MKVLNRICVQRIGNAHQMQIRGTNTRALGYNNFTNSEDKDKIPPYQGLFILRR